jgi:hypothetical protein
VREKIHLYRFRSEEILHEPLPEQSAFHADQFTVAELRRSKSIPSFSELDRDHECVISETYGATVIYFAFDHQRMFRHRRNDHAVGRKSERPRGTSHIPKRI